MTGERICSAARPPRSVEVNKDWTCPGRERRKRRRLRRERGNASLAGDVAAGSVAGDGAWGRFCRIVCNRRSRSGTPPVA